MGLPVLKGAHAEIHDEHGTRVTRCLSSMTSWLGSVTAVALAAGVVLAWLIGGLWVPRHWGDDTYQLLIGTVTSIVTFAMVFIIQNSQNRDGQALQAKLDAQNEVLFGIAQRLGGGDEGERLLKLVGLENAPEGKIRQHHADVQQALRHHSTS
jgi:low affinity Fe/Cu permease